MPIPERDVMHILVSLGRGGIETWLIQVFRNSKALRERSSICLIGDTPAKDYYEEIMGMGIPIYFVSFSYLGIPFVYRLVAFLKFTRPTVVHAHMNYLSGLVTLSGLLAGVPVRIAHYHVSYPEQHKRVVRRLYIHLVRVLEGLSATLILGCSAEALRSYRDIFGIRCPSKRVLYYGISLYPFLEPVDEKKIRYELGIPPDAFVISHIGRFVTQKNQGFLIHLLSELVKQSPETYLLLVGDGPLRPTIEEEVQREGLSDHVVFAGIRSDIPRLLVGATNIFVFPSLYEGLGLVLIEAQAAGIPCLVSEFVPEEAIIINELVRRISIRISVTDWIESINEIRQTSFSYDRVAATKLISESPFAIDANLQELQRIYGAPTAK